MTTRVGAQTDRFVVFGRRCRRSVGTPPQVSTHNTPSFLLLLQRNICTCEEKK
jgi:hypothetical protein